MSKDTKSTIWDYWAPRYHGLYVQKVSLGPSRRLVHARIEEAAPEARRFLDVGCGIGQFASELAAQRPNAEVVAVDPTPGMIERAQRDFSHPRVEYLRGSAHDVPRDDGFDVITCMHAFPYVPDADSTAGHLRELLRTGGRLLLIQANTHNLWDRLILFFVSRTTTTAHYRSTAELLRIFEGAGLRPGLVRALPRPWFIPSIHLVEGLR